MPTINAQITDTNHKPRGLMHIEVEFDHQGHPWQVFHNQQHFTFTGKNGTNIKTGLAVVEMATEADARLWISLDGAQVWED